MFKRVVLLIFIIFSITGLSFAAWSLSTRFIESNSEQIDYVVGDFLDK